MVKKKPHRSLFSSLVPQLTGESSSTDTYQLIDNEYFAAFGSLTELEQFHSKIIEKHASCPSDAALPSSEPDESEMDMKSFAQQFLIDPPTTTSETSSQELFSTEQAINWSPKVKDPKKRKQTPASSAQAEIGSKRQRRHVRDLPQSSSFIFMSDDDRANIFDCVRESTRSKRIGYEDMSSILLTLDAKQKKKRSGERNENDQPTIGVELAESSIIKEEPTEPEQLVISHVVEAKEEPVELNVTSTGPMGFGTADFSGHLDNYVQNIHRSCTTNVSVSIVASSRPKRIRKRKKFYSEESEAIVRNKRIRKKLAPITQPPPPALLTDAEIEQQFGERLSPTIKMEQEDETQAMANSRVVIEIEPVPQTPIERARAKLIHALGRGHGPDTFLLKIRSRENKMIEVQLAIYGTADWHSHRTKILAKIEEALRGLRVSWTKIDIRVDDFDVQICTSSQAAAVAPPPSLTNSNSSWFLKVLSESGPLIVHIHDRRRPQQRLRIKCPCPHCSPNEPSTGCEMIVVSVSPEKGPARHLSPPAILRRAHSTFHSSLSSLQNIHTTFFKDLIQQHGTNTVSSVTQCVLDLALIVSVHASLPYLQTSANETNEDYRRKYQQIIDPLKYTSHESENPSPPNTKPMVSISATPDILEFYGSIKKNKANIRNAQVMRNLIVGLAPKTELVPTSSTIIKATPITTLILPKSTVRSTRPRPLFVNRSARRSLIQTETSFSREHSSAMKQQAHFTPIIELKPILSSSTSLVEEPRKEAATKKITKIISTNTIQKDSQRLNTITTQEIPSQLSNGTRVIRLSIAKPSVNSHPSSSSPTIRLISPTASVNKGESVPLVPKQINIIKPFSSSIVPANKLTNTILIASRIQEQSSTK